MRSELDSLRSKLAGLGLSRHARIGAGVEVNEPLHSVVSLSNSPVIFAHVFYPDVWSEIVDALNASALNFRLVVTMPDGHPNPRIPDGATDYEVITVQNRGRDVRPFLQALRETKFEYDLGLKIHTKMSLHRDDGEAWRRALLRSLLGTADHSHEIVRRLQTFPSIGLVGPSGHKVSIEEFGFENNVEKMKSILSPHTNLEGRMFFAGTMFWFRRQAFTELMIPSPDIFEEESGQVDGTFAHAYERSFSIICEERGLESVSVEELLAGRSPRTIDHRRDAVSIYLRPGHVTLEEYEQSRGLLPALVRNETLRSVFRRLPAPVKNFVRARILQ
jgi:lipopolysaccharide biosynthesis protein